MAKLTRVKSRPEGNDDMLANINHFTNVAVHILCSVEKFSSDKKYKERKEILAAICALLNSNGGVVVVTICSEGQIKELHPSQLDALIRNTEQCILSTIGIIQTKTNVNFKVDKEKIIILVKRADSLITTSYNLYLPSETQVVSVSPQDPLPRIIDAIIKRKTSPDPVQLGSHWNKFVKNENCGFCAKKNVQWKYLSDVPTKRTRLSDRMTSKSNKLACYISAFANHSGGHIYYGIKDDGVVHGELIANEDTDNIAMKVAKVVNKMIWPEQIRQPTRGEHWEIFFEPVSDENCERIPSTFVIVVYIAACFGGVFIEEPECYEMVEGRVVKMSMATWRRRIVQPLWLHSKHEIPQSVGRVNWSSARVRRLCTIADQELMQCINNGNWEITSKIGERLEKRSLENEISSIKLLVLSKTITASYRRGHFKEATVLLHTYKGLLPQTQDQTIFEVMQLFLEAALARAKGNLDELKVPLDDALTQADSIEPGLIPAIVYIFAATVADLVDLEGFTPEDLSLRALDHLKRVPDSSEIIGDMDQKSHITLATFHLGGNIRGQRTRDKVDCIELEKARRSLNEIHQSVCEGNPLNRYREVQLYLVQSMYYCRHAQLFSDGKVRFLKNAFNCAKDAERLAKYHQFTEMLEWSKAQQALCTEELLRAHFTCDKKNPSAKKDLPFCDDSIAIENRY